jgi:hypothetical protein
VLRWRGLGAASRRRGSGTISTRGSVAVVRAGDYIGAAIACRFAREVFSGVCGRRSGDKLAPPIAEIEAEVLAPLEATVFNVGANVNFPVLETTERVFRKVWELARYAGFLTGREAARLMLPRGSGSIFFTGATASMRGGTGFAAFASAKFGPQGVHVADLVIDAGVDTAWVRARIARRGGAAGTRPIDEPRHHRRNLLAPA